MQAATKGGTEDILLLIFEDLLNYSTAIGSGMLSISGSMKIYPVKCVTQLHAIYSPR